MSIKIILKTAALGLSVFLAATPAMAAKTLVYCSEASPSGFDPGLYTDGASYDASSRTVYSRLVTFEHGTTKIEPDLAESWDISQDGLTYTFHLRKGVKFQTTRWFTPTRDFNADDVLFTFDRMRDKNHPWHNYLTGASWQYYEAMNMPKIIKTIEKLDDYTVRFTLSQVEAPFLADLAMDFASIVSKEYADKLAAEGKQAELNTRPVGTGPFAFVAYQNDSMIRYKAHPDYYRGKQKLDNLVFAITVDNSVRAQRLRSGECHVMSYPAPTDIAALKADPNINVMEEVGMNVGYMAYNTLQPPFDKAEVRRALNMAINKPAIVEAVFAGQGEVARNPLPPAIWGYNDAIKPDVYDPEKAKAMLEAAGVKNLEMKIWAMPASRTYMPNARRAAEMMQADLAKIGVKASIVTMEWGEYLKRGTDKNRDGAMMVGWMDDNGDPDNFLATLNNCAAIGTNNYANWCYKPYEDLIQQAKRVTDIGERTKLYEQAQVIFKEQAPWLLIAHGKTIMPMSKKVQNFYVDPHGVRFDDVDLED